MVCQNVMETEGRIPSRALLHGLLRPGAAGRSRLNGPVAVSGTQCKDKDGEKGENVILIFMKSEKGFHKE